MWNNCLCCGEMARMEATGRRTAETYVYGPSVMVDVRVEWEEVCSACRERGCLCDGRRLGQQPLRFWTRRTDRVVLGLSE